MRSGCDAFYFWFLCSIGAVQGAVDQNLGRRTRQRRLWQPAQHRPEQCLRVDGLGDVVHHAGLNAALALLRHGMRGEGKDGDALEPWLRANQACGLDTVHAGYFHVHQHEIIGIGKEHLEGFRAVVCRGDRGARACKEFSRDMPVGLVVVHQQQACTVKIRHRRVRPKA